MRMKSITKYMMYCAVLMGLTACNENSIFEGELYKKVVYVLSETDLTFPGHSFAEYSGFRWIYSHLRRWYTGY